MLINLAILNLNFILPFSKFGLPGLLVVCLFSISGTNLVHAQSDKYQEAFTAYQTQDFGNAEALWRELAEQGDPNAQYALGVMALRAETKNANENQAFLWFQQAASQGHSTAMFNLGVAYWDGSGVDQDRKMALQWWGKSAKLGDSEAQYNLGYAYFIGDVRPTNIALASKWIGMAAEQNNSEAIRMYEIIKQDKSNISIAAAEENVSIVSDIQEPENVSESAPVPTISDQKSAKISEEPEIPTNIVEAKAAPQNEYWRLSADSELRISPRQSGFVFNNLSMNAPIEIIDTQGEWNLITLPAGLKTWVFADYLNVDGDNGTIRGTGVRVRPQPTTDDSASPPLGAYRNGDQVTVLEKTNQWYQIRAPKYIGGWVRKSKIESYLDSEDNRQKLWDSLLTKGL